MLSKPINSNTISVPGDIALGLLRLDGVAKPSRAMAIISKMNDSGPNEILVLGDQQKLNVIFSRGISSFIDLLNEDYRNNRFYIFKSRPQPISLSSISCMIDNPITEDGRYIAFWGQELPPSHRKNSWPLHLLERTGKAVIGSFEAIDIIRESAMMEMLHRIKRDGKRA